MGKNNKLLKTLFCTPLLIYSILLIALPIIYVIIISFFKNDAYGGIVQTFTLENYIALFDEVYIKIFLQSFLVAIVTSLICILISYPFVLAVCHKSKNLQKVFMTLIMVPFLTNSLIRMYGWIVLLRKSGIINTLLIKIGIISTPLNLMYNKLGIIIGMVYTLLPFMLLPLYSSMSTIDKKTLEAASDLGANKLNIFTKIIFPHTLPGLFNGVIMVFTPALGYFFIVDVLGGGKIMILGNLIKNQFLTARNWPFGASISVVLILVTALLIYIYKRIGGKMDDLGG